MRPVVFLWENFGPYHLDRLRAVAADGRRVIGIQLAATSNTYGWAASDAAGLDIRTLLAAGEHRSHGKLTWRLLREARRIGPADWFLCHYEQPAVFAAALALRLRGRVFAMFESKFDDYPRRWWWEAGKVALLSPYAGALVPTPRARDYLAFLGLSRRVAFGYSTVSVARVRALLGSAPAPDGATFPDRDWVAVSRLVSKKNLQLAIAAYAAWLPQAQTPRDLHLLGSGPLEAELRAQATALGVTARVHFHGFVQADAVSHRLARSLALLLPSVEEQFGLVAIEAQAAGLPVLATPQVGATDVLIDGGLNGFVLPLGKPESWAASMLLLSEDEARWCRFATAARDGAGRGDVARFAEGVAALTRT